MRIYVDMDGVLCNYNLMWNSLHDTLPSVEFPQALRGFFEDMKPIQDSIESLNWLRNNHDVYILTAPSTRNPYSYMEKRLWIEKHFDYELAYKLILSNFKDYLKGDILIDDRIMGKGQDKFEGKHILFESLQYPNWNDIIEKFKIGEFDND